MVESNGMVHRRLDGTFEALHGSSLFDHFRVVAIFADVGDAVHADFVHGVQPVAVRAPRLLDAGRRDDDRAGEERELELLVRNFSYNN